MNPVRGAGIALEGDMSHPGMAPVFGEARETEPGRYTGHLSFYMAGDWTILLHVTLANGEKSREKQDEHECPTKMHPSERTPERCFRFLG